MDVKRILSALGICSGCVVIALVFSMTNTALPAIQEELNLSISQTQWMMSVFGLINCSVLVTFGRLADIYGRKRIYLLGLIFSGVGMGLGGSSTDSVGLILCMFFAGLGNAIILPVSQALLVSEFPANQRGRAVGIWAAAIAAALAIGPILGGVIAGSIGWQWIFWINGQVIAISFLLIYFFSKESRNTEDPSTVDYKGMMLLSLSLFSFVLLITEYRALTEALQWILCAFVVTGVFMLWRVERRAAAPILRSDLFTDPRFLASSLSNACLVFYIWSLFFLFPLYLQNVRQLAPLTGGYLMLGITLPVAVLSPLIGRLYRLQTAWIWITLGFCLMVISTLMQQSFNETTDLMFIAASTTIFGIAYSFVWGPSTTAAVSTLSTQRAGIVTGTFVTIQEIGGTLGLTITVTVAKMHDNFLNGFQNSMRILTAIAVLGCLFGLILSLDRFNKRINEPS